MKNKYYSTALIAMIGLIGFNSQSAFAHKIIVFAWHDGETVRGEVYFQGGGKACNMTVKAFDSEGKLSAETKTDEKGQFYFSTKLRAKHKIIADMGDGHRGEFLLNATRPSDIPPVDKSVHQPAQTSQFATRNQVIELQKMIVEMRNEIRFRDIIGSVGYIVGLFGILFFFLARRQRSRASAASKRTDSKRTGGNAS